MSPAAPPARPVLRLLPLVLIVLTGFLSIGVPLSVLSLRVHDALGFDAVTVGWTIGIQSLATVMTRGVAGHVVDRHGPKASVLAGLPLASLAGLAYLASLAAASPSASLTVLLAGRILLGVAESLFLTGTMTWGIGRLGPAWTGLVMAWQGIAIYGALGLGAPAGLAVYDRFGFAGVAVLTVVLPLLGAAIALPLPGIRPIPAKRVRFHRVVGLIWRQGGALALGTAPFAILTAFLALHYGALGWSGAGSGLTAFAAGFILVRLLFARLPDRFGGRAVAAVSLAVEAAGLILIWAAPVAPVALAGAFLTGLGFSLIFPAMGVDALRRVPPESRGMAVGGFVAFLDVAIGLGAPLAGLLVEPFGLPAVFLAGAVSCLAGLAVVLGLLSARSA